MELKPSISPIFRHVNPTVTVASVSLKSTDVPQSAIGNVLRVLSVIAQPLFIRHSPRPQHITTEPSHCRTE